MSRIVVDSDQLQALDGGRKAAEVCDDTGRVVGRFVPEDEYLRYYAPIDWNQPIADDIRRQALNDLANGRCVTTEELLAGLDELDEALRKLKHRPT